MPVYAQLRARARVRAQRRLADGLRRAIDRAGQRPPLCAAVPVSPAAGSRSREALEQLIGRLQRGNSADEHGLALTRRLLVDPGSPLYADLDGDALWQAARAALLALGSTRPAPQPQREPVTPEMAPPPREAAWHA